MSDEKKPGRFYHGWIGVRGLAFCLGAFSIFNWMLGLVAGRFDANLWWLDLRVVPFFLRPLFIPGAAMVLLIFATLPVWTWTSRIRSWVALAASISALLLALVGVLNTQNYLQLLMQESFSSAFPVPLSSLISLLLIWISFRAYQHRRKARDGEQVSAKRQLLGTIVIFFLLFPLLQMFFYGYTDYRRKADAILAFGAGVRADGSMSLALYDRTRTAVDLYENGLAPYLIFSGGPGPGGHHEALVMRAYALQRGVPADAILLDQLGLNTWSSVKNSIKLVQNVLPKRKSAFSTKPRILAVSTFYHLPRIKMAFHQAGSEVYTVPASETRVLFALPVYLFREILAFWFYYCRASINSVLQWSAGWARTNAIYYPQDAFVRKRSNNHVLIHW